jgi:hypothetical protein
MDISTLCNAYAQLGARGVSILFASGDGGVGGGQSGERCTKFIPTFPNNCPLYVTIAQSLRPCFLTFLPASPMLVLLNCQVAQAKPLRRFHLADSQTSLVFRLTKLLLSRHISPPLGTPMLANSILLAGHILMLLPSALTSKLLSMVAQNWLMVPAARAQSSRLSLH